MKLSELDDFILENDLIVDTEEMSGIYAITINKGIVYVGQSKNVYQRCRQHIYNIENAMLNKEKKYLLLLSAKLGGYDVDCSYLEYCDQDVLNDRENYYIEYCNPCLNILTPTGKRDISNLTIGGVLNSITKRLN